MKNQKTVHTYLCTFKHQFYIVENANRITINIFCVGVLILCLLVYSFIAKSNPTIPATRLTAFKRAKSLGNGVSFSWLEQTWNKDALAKPVLMILIFCF